MKSYIKGAALAVAVGILPALALGADPDPATTSPLTFDNTVTGEPLDLTIGPKEGRDTPAVKEFFKTGVDPYIEVKDCLPKAQTLFLESCSGCHGQVGEGKIGPGLNDNYWTYPKNTTDKGIFETIYGGARAQMGPHSDLQLDELMLIIAWIRHLYTGPVEDADWLTDEQKKTFKPYDADHPVTLKDTGQCKIPGQ
jgi:cytochrome c-L